MDNGGGAGRILTQASTSVARTHTRCEEVDLNIPARRATTGVLCVASSVSITNTAVIS